jgi:hypothetical protein
MFKDCGSYWLSLAKQGTDEWKRLRKGRITASRVLEAIRNPRSLSVEVKVNDAMRHGTETEPIARDWYIKTTGNAVEEVGIAIPKWELRLGASPDGLVGERGMIEIKCPLRMYGSVKVYSYLKSKGREGPLPVSPSHYAQIQTNLAILDRDWCDYVVYAGEVNVIYRVDRDRVYWEDLYAEIREILGEIEEGGRIDP